MVYVVPLSMCCLIVPCLIKFIEVVKGAGYSSTAKSSMVSKWEWVDILILTVPLSKLVFNGMSV